MARMSKNSRSTTKTKGPAIAGVKFLIPVGGGTGAYVFNPVTSTNPRLVVAGEEFTAAIAAIVEAGHGPKVTEELVALNQSHPNHGWDKTLARLVDAGVLAN